MNEELFKDIESFLADSTKFAPQSLFTDQELQAILDSMPLDISKEDAEKIIDWVIETKIGENLLGLIFKGFIDVSIKDNEPVFKLSAKGAEIARSFNR